MEKLWKHGFGLNEKNRFKIGYIRISKCNGYSIWNRYPDKRSEYKNDFRRYSDHCYNVLQLVYQKAQNNETSYKKTKSNMFGLFPEEMLSKSTSFEQNKETIDDFVLIERDSKTENQEEVYRHSSFKLTA